MPTEGHRGTFRQLKWALFFSQNTRIIGFSDFLGRRIFQIEFLKIFKLTSKFLFSEKEFQARDVWIRIGREAWVFITAMILSCYPIFPSKVNQAWTETPEILLLELLFSTRQMTLLPSPRSRVEVVSMTDGLNALPLSPRHTSRDPWMYLREMLYKFLTWMSLFCNNFRAIFHHYFCFVFEIISLISLAKEGSRRWCIFLISRKARHDRQNFRTRRSFITWTISCHGLLSPVIGCLRVITQPSMPGRSWRKNLPESSDDQWKELFQFVRLICSPSCFLQLNYQEANIAHVNLIIMFTSEGADQASLTSFFAPRKFILLHSNI